MNGRKKVTKQLKGMSADMTSSRSDPYYKPSDEDIEDAKYAYSLAKKNEAGTLSIKEAMEVLEMFEGDDPVIVDTESGRWVEIE